MFKSKLPGTLTCKSVQNKEINNNLQINLKHMQTNNKKVKSEKM